MNHSADLYQAFFNTASDPIFVLDAATKTIVKANAQAIKYTGYRPDEIAGLSIDRLFRSQNGVELLFFFQNADDATTLVGLQLLKKNGETIAVNVSTTCVGWNLAKYLFVIVREGEAALPHSHPNTEIDSAPWPEREDFPTIIGQSGKIRKACRLIGSVAKSETTVLIQGESGTGKEIIANAIHAHSYRYRGPFVKVNCAALTETLLESEFFGHVKGAFTGAIRDRRGRFKQADGGTILLDEIGGMPLSGQVKLLRVLQEREFEPVGSSVTTPVNVRVIAATNTDLLKAVEEGKFREDLYYRLNVFLITLPPLRERKEDIPLLIQHFLRQYNQAIGKEIRTIAPETLTLLIDYEWPGNVRELENTVEHAVIVEKGPVMLPSSLPMNLSKSCGADPAPELAAELGLREKLNLLERQILLDTLFRANWIKKQAAAMLRIDARNLPYLMRKHDLSESVQRH
jgi:two-component system, NtrC family, response regulator AtoC